MAPTWILITIFAIPVTGNLIPNNTKSTKENPSISSPSIKTPKTVNMNDILNQYQVIIKRVPPMGKGLMEDNLYNKDINPYKDISIFNEDTVQSTNDKQEGNIVVGNDTTKKIYYPAPTNWEDSHKPHLLMESMVKVDINDSMTIRELNEIVAAKMMQLIENDLPDPGVEMEAEEDIAVVPPPGSNYNHSYRQIPNRFRNFNGIDLSKLEAEKDNALAPPFVSNSNSERLIPRRFRNFNSIDL